jgi:hypothetical protein
MDEGACFSTYTYETVGTVGSGCSRRFCETTFFAPFGTGSILMDLVDGAAGAAQGAVHCHDLVEVLPDGLVNQLDLSGRGSLAAKFVDHPEQDGSSEGGCDERTFHATYS